MMMLATWISMIMPEGRSAANVPDSMITAVMTVTPMRLIECSIASLMLLFANSSLQRSMMNIESSMPRAANMIRLKNGTAQLRFQRPSRPSSHCVMVRDAKYVTNMDPIIVTGRISDLNTTASMTNSVAIKIVMTRV